MVAFHSLFVHYQILATSFEGLKNAHEQCLGIASLVAAVAVTVLFRLSLPGGLTVPADFWRLTSKNGSGRWKSSNLQVRCD